MTVTKRLKVEPSETLLEIYNLYKRYNSLSPMRIKQNFGQTLYDNRIDLIYLVKKFKLNKNSVYAYTNEMNNAKPSLQLLVRLSVELKLDILDFLA